MEQLIGFFEVFCSLFRPAEVQKTTPHGIRQDGYIGIGTAIVLTHLVESIHRHTQSALVVTFLQHHTGKPTSRLVIVQRVVFGLDLCLNGFLIVELRGTILALVVVGHTTPSVGIHRRQVTNGFQTVGKFQDTGIVACFSCGIHNAVSLAGTDPGTP